MVAVVPAEAHFDPAVASLGKLPSVIQPDPRTNVVPRPPALRRQNACRFAWPPDQGSHWTYICLGPEEFSHQLLEVRARCSATFANGTCGHRQSTAS